MITSASGGCCGNKRNKRKENSFDPDTTYKTAFYFVSEAVVAFEDVFLHKLCHPSIVVLPAFLNLTMIPFLLLLLSLFTSATATTYTWPSYQYDALEQLLFEGTRSDGSSLASIVHPCRLRTGTLASIAAEWLRFVRVPDFFLFFFEITVK